MSLSDWGDSPEALAERIDPFSDAELAQEVERAGVEAVLDHVFDAMARSFRPEAAGGKRRVLQWMIEAGEGAHPYQVQVEGAQCTAERGAAEAPDVTLAAPVPVFLRIVAGRVNGLQAFGSGALRVTGDTVTAVEQQLWFSGSLDEAELDVHTPSGLARLVDGRSDAEILAGVRVTGYEKVLDRVFEGMVAHFMPRAAPRRGALVEFRIVVPQAGEHVRQFVADPRGPGHRRGRARNPNVSIRVGMADFLRMVAGRLDGVRAFTQGKVRVRGNLLLARKVPRWFDMSR